MEYNIHPIIVHFPIAFLFLYSLIVILPVNRWFPSQSWLFVRILLLTLGFLGLLAATSSGEVAEDFTKGSHDVIEMHEAFANASVWLYGLLLAGELLPFLERKILRYIRSLAPLFTFLNNILRNRIIIWVLALAGLGSLLLTGMLGGILVYGTTADPLAPLLLNILGIN